MSRPQGAGLLASWFSEEVAVGRGFTADAARQGGALSPDGHGRWAGERWVDQPLPVSLGWGDSVVAAVIDLRTARPATWAVLAVAAVVGVLTDLAFRASDVGLAAALLLVAICAGLVASRRGVNRHGVVALGLAALLAAFLAVRESAWLLVPGVVVALGLVLLACGLATEGSLLDLSFARAQALGIRVMLHLPVGSWHVVPPLRTAISMISGGGRAAVPG